MPAGRVRIRPMDLADFEIRIAYFHEATDEHLNRLGVDRWRLPRPDAWRGSFQQNLARPLEERSEYGVVWELDGRLVGFSTADQIRIGDEAHMHLHIVDPERLAAGLGTQFVRLTAEHLCDVLRLKRLSGVRKNPRASCMVSVEPPSTSRWPGVKSLRMAPRMRM